MLNNTTIEEVQTPKTGGASLVNSRGKELEEKSGPLPIQSGMRVASNKSKDRVLSIPQTKPCKRNTGGGDRKKGTRRSQKLAVVSQGIVEGEEKKQGEMDAESDKHEQDLTVMKYNPWALGGRKFKFLTGLKIRLECKDTHRILDCLLDGEKFTYVLEGDRALVRVYENVGFGNPVSDWRNLLHFEKSFPAISHLAFGVKTDMDNRSLVPALVSEVRKRVEPWPTINADAATWLRGDWVAKYLLEDIKIKADQAIQLDLVKKYREGINFGLSAQQIEYVIGLVEANKFFHTNKSLIVAIIAVSIGFAVGLFHFGHYYAASLFFLIVVGTLLRLYYSAQAATDDEKMLKFFWYLMNTEQDTRVRYASIIEIFSTCSSALEWGPWLKKWFKDGDVTINVGDQEKPCKSKSPYDVFGVHVGGSRMVIPHQCHHDQAHGLNLRYLADRKWDGGSIKDIIQKSQDFWLDFDFSPHSWKSYTFEEWSAHLPGKRRKLLEEAKDILEVEPFVPVDIFVKLEAYIGKLEDDWKPRIIMGRSLEYQKKVGPYFYSISKWLAMELDGRKGCWYDSSLTAEKLGSIATNMFSNFKYVYMIDVSNWDGHLHPGWLKFETWFIETFAPALPNDWKNIKKNWNRVEGVGKNGISFKTCHGRRSGDMWTSCFNTLINLSIVKNLFPDSEVVAKGDDNFFGTNSNVSADWIIEQYALIGMKAKVFRVLDMDSLEYCSGKFWPTDRGYKWGVNPVRTLSKFGLNLHRHPKKVHHRLLYGTAISMMSIAGHVPFIGELLQAIIHAGQRAGLAPIMPQEEFWKTVGEAVDPIHHSSYNIVARDYNLSPEEVQYMIWDLTLRRGFPLEMTDFPLHLVAPSWDIAFRCEQADHVGSIGNNVIVRELVENTCREHHLPFDNLNIVIVPFVEEFLKSQFPFLVLVFAILEGLCVNYINFFVHISLYAISSYSIWLSILLHFGYNYQMWREARSKIRIRHLTPTAQIGYCTIKGTSNTPLEIMKYSIFSKKSRMRN